MCAWSDTICGARLAQHPGAKVSLASQIWPDQLDGHDAVDEHVPRPIDDAHATLADASL
jgi:hypothetical protein